MAAFINGCAQAPTAPVPVPATSSSPRVRAACDSTAACVASIKSAVENHWKERYLFDQRLRATLLIKLDREFNVTSVSIVQGSGEAKFDESALRAVRNTSPFRELRGLPEKERAPFDAINFVFGSASP